MPPIKGITEAGRKSYGGECARSLRPGSEQFRSVLPPCPLWPPCCRVASESVRIAAFPSVHRLRADNPNARPLAGMGQEYEGSRIDRLAPPTSAGARRPRAKEAGSSSLDG